jgi:hypothetical protein
MKFRIVLLALALGACNQTAPKQAGGTAGGEVLPGSTSDAMLPLDTVRSQPPLAPRVESTGRPAEKGARPAAAARASSAPAAETPAAAEPAAEAAAPEGE